MSKPKSKAATREAAAIEALRQGMALVRRGREVYGLRVDGSRELIVEGDDHREVWAQVLEALQTNEKMADSVDNKPNTPESVVSKTTKLKLYSDGGSRGNPGPSATGYVIMNEDESQVLEQGGKYLGITTNNQAEYQAVKQALEAAVKFQPDEIIFSIDSQLVVNQLNGIYKVKNKELWPVHQAIKELAAQFKSVTFQHVYREHNTLADEQVNIILDKEAELQNG